MTRKRTRQEFCNRINKRFGNEISVVGEYYNDETLIAVRHNKCGSVWKIKPKNILRSKNGSCPMCSRVPHTLTQSEFEKRVREVGGGEYSFEEPYSGANTSILCKHLKCGFRWKVRPSNFFNRHVRCPECGKNVRKDTAYFCKELEQLVGNEYSLLTEYKGAREYVTLRHELCGHFWKVWPNSFLNGTRCPNCTRSKGEDYIRDFLEARKIKYVAQKVFKDCRDKRPLPFDFYLPQYNLIIEYDGKQHEGPVDHFGGQKSFEILRRHDDIKNKYCDENNMRILRIPYYIKGDQIADTISKHLLIEQN